MITARMMLPLSAQTKPRGHSLKYRRSPSRLSNYFSQNIENIQNLSLWVAVEVQSQSIFKNMIVRFWNIKEITGYRDGTTKCRSGKIFTTILLNCRTGVSTMTCYCFIFSSCCLPLPTTCMSSLQQC